MTHSTRVVTQHRARWIVLGFAAMVIGWAGPACANVPVPAIFALHLPAHMGLAVFVATLLLVSIIEAVALVRFFGQGWRWSLLVCFQANVVSTLIGAILSGAPTLGLFVLAITLTHLANTRWHWNGFRRAVLVVGVVIALFALIMPWPTIPATVIQIYAMLVMAFALSVLIESFFFSAKAGSPRRSLRWAFGVNCVSYLAILVVMITLNFRTGAFAMREWFLFRVSTSGQAGMTPGQAITFIEEFYAWEQSGGRMHMAGKHPKLPNWELRLVERWADDGDVAHARELLQVVHAHYPNPEDNWAYSPAIKALSGAGGRDPVVSENDSTTGTEGNSVRGSE